MRKSLIPILTILLTFTAFGFRGCNDPNPNAPDKQKQIVSIAATSVDIAATALTSGIVTVRGFRRSGDVKPEDALKMARLGKRANAIALKGAERILRLDGIDGDVVTIIEELVAAGQELSSEGVLVIKGRKQLVFTGITTASLIVLQSQGDELRKLAGENSNLKLTLDADSRRKLERAVKTLEANDRELDASIAELVSQ